MPSSNYESISYVIGEVKRLNPKSILDVGIGQAKYGVLFREYLETWSGRPYKKDWRVEIVGVEIFSKYRTPVYDWVYDEVIWGDAYDYIFSTDKTFDLIFFSDVIEHFEKEKAFKLIEMANKISKNVIINVPIGSKEIWRQNASFGNENERHLSFWEADDFDGNVRVVKDYRGRDYGTITI